MGQYDELLKSEAFSCLSAEKKKVFIEIAEAVKGKSAIEAMGILTKYMPKLNQGKPLSEAERNAMIAALTANMSEAEQKRVSEAMRMIASMQGR